MAISYLHKTQNTLGRFNSGSYSEQLISDSEKEDIKCVETALHTFYDSDEALRLYELAHKGGSLFDVYRDKLESEISGLNSLSRSMVSRKLRKSRDASIRAVSECVLLKSQVTAARNIEGELKSEKYHSTELGSPITLWNGTPYYANQSVTTKSKHSSIIKKQDTGLSSDIFLHSGKTGKIIKVVSRTKRYYKDKDIEQPQSVLVHWDSQSWKATNSEVRQFPEFSSSLHVSSLK